MTNAPQDDDPKTPEEFERLFDAIVNSSDFPNDYEFTGSLFSVQANLAVGGIKNGLPWLGASAMEFKDLDSLRKAAKNFRFYFDNTPKISLYISKQTKFPRKKGTFKEICYLGSVPWHVLDEL